MPRGQIIEDEPRGVPFHRQEDGLALARIEGDLCNSASGRSAERSRFDPIRQLWEAWCDFGRDRWWDDDSRKQLLKQRELVDLSERDEDARVGYDDRSHASIEAFSAAQSSLVIWK